MLNRCNVHINNIVSKRLKEIATESWQLTNDTTMYCHNKKQINLLISKIDIIQ